MINGNRFKSRGISNIINELKPCNLFEMNYKIHAPGTYSLTKFLQYKSIVSNKNLNCLNQTVLHKINIIHIIEFKIIDVT